MNAPLAGYTLLGVSGYDNVLSKITEFNMIAVPKEDGKSGERAGNDTTPFLKAYGAYGVLPLFPF